MLVKPKKCKGTSKAIGYGCGQLNTYRVYGLGKECKCYQNWLLTSDAGKEQLSKIILKVNEKTKKEHEREVRQKRINEKKRLRESLTVWKNELQDEINLIARLIDKDLPCLAKGKYSNQTHGGHIFSRGSNQTIRYNLHNIHRQSAQSNHFQNEDGLLREGLVNEYGQPYMDFISELRRTPSLEYNNDDFRQLTIKARSISARLKKDDLAYNLEQRIELRNQINIELGIYLKEYCVYKLETT
jgi:hypothetical protein